ncbi:MAG: manganese catalase family protein [Acetatifactor sp.]|nr:manganese catalase family protein [Acetatifactor sp.]
MWSYERRLQFPVNIKNPNAQLAQAIISQYGGPDGEMGASMRYLSQKFATPYKEVAGLLNDIGVSVSKLHILDLSRCPGSFRFRGFRNFQ